MEKRITKKMKEEFFYYLNREKKKLEIVFEKVKVKKEGKKVFELAKSYFKDMKYFFDKKEYVKVFELENYIWGILDTLANFNLLIIPKGIKKWFKV